jgi:DNA-binding response OmpR family regulator
MNTTYSTSKEWIRAAALVHDSDTAIVVRTALQCAGISCTEFHSVESLLRSARHEHYQLLVMDADGIGNEWRNMLDWRSNWLNPSVPLIGLGPADPDFASRALASGVDDYLAKPLHGGELLARVNAATRRSQDNALSPVLTAVSCTLDRRASALCCRSAQVMLTSHELGVLQLLLRNLGKLVTRQRIAAEVWSCDTDAMGRTIVQHIYQLRRKLKRCTGGTLVIHSVYGSGYRLEALETDAAVAMVREPGLNGTALDSPARAASPDSMTLVAAQPNA